MSNANKRKRTHAAGREIFLACSGGVFVMTFLLTAIIKLFVWRNAPTFTLITLIFFISAILIALMGVKSYENSKDYDTEGRNFKNSKNATYGDARVLPPSALPGYLYICDINDARGFIFGQLPLDSTQAEYASQTVGLRLDIGTNTSEHQPVRCKTVNRNGLVAAGSGQGKSESFLKPNVIATINRRESCLIVDPDGGPTSQTFNMFLHEGYICRIFNLNEPLLSDGWDCMKILRSPTGEYDDLNVQLSILDLINKFAETLNTAIVSHSNSGGGGQGDAQASSGMLFIKALLCRIIFSDVYSEEEKNIETLYNLMQMFGQDAQSNEKKGTLANIIHNELSRELSHNPNMKYAVEAHKLFSSASERFYGNIITSITSTLGNALSNPAIRIILSKDDIDIEQAAKQPCVTFCNFPDSDNPYYAIVSLFISMTYNVLRKYADTYYPGKGLPIPFQFWMDEFVNIGVLPHWASVLATCRKRNIGVIMIIQTMELLENNYPTTYNSIIDNCAFVASIGVTDENGMAKWFSEHIGTTTVVAKSMRGVQDGNDSFLLHHEHTEGDGQRQLFTPDEIIKKAGDGTTLVLIQGQNPVIVDKIWGFELPHFKRYKKYNPISDHPAIIDAEARKKRFTREEQCIRKYNRRHQGETIDYTYHSYFYPVPHTTSFDKAAETFNKAAEAVSGTIRQQAQSIRKRRNPKTNTSVPTLALMPPKCQVKAVRVTPPTSNPLNLSSSHGFDAFPSKQGNKPAPVAKQPPVVPKHPPTAQKPPEGAEMPPRGASGGNGEKTPPAGFPATSPKPGAKKPPKKSTPNPSMAHPVILGMDDEAKLAASLGSIDQVQEGNDLFEF